LKVPGKMALTECYEEESKNDGLEKFARKELPNSYVSLNCNYWQDQKLADYDIFRAWQD